ncbi:helix-turn-helix transcriptional regulator [Methyloligella sp. 2.7D]|uniref:S24 family peptidase n=1 Tax=unclassified Methyloligella TaxID=2625955 RepID=UPI00157BF143|nr:helix-turn-helix transcriptional regulator [Methyloligella sp. GL2]QKP78487.1 helix-turn-helix transcriptional regulator [Methyloligella sp. GL2]
MARSAPPPNLRRPGKGAAGEGPPGQDADTALTHSKVWSAIDALAARYGLSVSGLAKRAGLDATAFNRSKRITAEGRPRWPTTESLAKVLEATGADLGDLVALLRQEASAQDAIPLIELAQAGSGGFGETGSAWEHVAPPALQDENAYALEVTGDSMAPLYRAGDVLLVSPRMAVAEGDRVVLKTKDGEVMAKILVKRGPKTVELAALNPEQPNLVFPTKRIEWMHRILWVSQ